MARRRPGRFPTVAARPPAIPKPWRRRISGRKPGSTRTRNLYLWVVPADVDALWCGEGNATGTRMTIAQQYQRGTATLSNVRGVYHFEAAIDAIEYLPEARTRPRAGGAKGGTQP